MNVRKVPLRIAVLSTLVFATSAQADWVVSPNIEAIRPAPSNLQDMPQNPPAFSWSRHSSLPPGYVLEVSKGGVVAYTFNTTRNWYLPTAVFPQGTYSWRVRPSNTSEWSTPRSFTISANAAPFLVPDNAVLRTNVINKARPRQLPAGFTAATAWTSAMSAERGSALTSLKNEVNSNIVNLRAVSDSLWPLVSGGATTAAISAQNSDIRNKINKHTRQVEAASLLYRLTADPKYLAEARKRGDELASLSPTGPTSYANQDQATRAIALSLTKSIDLLSREIDATRRANWNRIIDVRGTAIYNALAGNNLYIDQYPLDSHAGTALGFMSVISTLALGEFANASRWFDFATRAYINSVYAWSGPEGGYGNGTAYGSYASGYAIDIWQPLTAATGVNLFSKPWSTGFMRYFAHFVPPGSPSHLFGDENELAPNFRTLKAYASRFNSPHAAWYANNITGAEDSLTLLQAQYPMPYKQATSVTPPPNAALYPSIGWVAMHSSMTDVNRTSLYFKSSPYGAYNHSHGDQNSIILNSGRRKLLIEAGYMDYYGSPLHKDWYRTTKAHNAITYNGGIGQPTDGNTVNLFRTGKITAFSTTPALDFAEGDATPAYGGALTSAKRKVWYLRNQNAVLVHDKVSSGTARAWEWNVHAAAPITRASDGSLTIVNVDRSVCIRPLVNGSTLSYQTRTGPAPKAGTVEVHGAYVHPSRTTGEFVMLLDVGCRRPTVTMSETSTSRTFVIGGSQTVTMAK
ncbi:MAG TPA: heparinase II/III family protein [Telluria sp.]|nr:heparinase II/III family protein [Telluria sp.]